jgi:hypothetical protein
VIRRADYATHLYPQTLALTLPTSGGRSVGIARLRTKATVLLLLISYKVFAVQFHSFSCFFLGLLFDSEEGSGKLHAITSQKIVIFDMDKVVRFLVQIIR